ncbi:Uncharacterized conserved protein UCP037205 [Isosphaera pallida ATCC 43644]|uniref:Uncharacterized conserved protein UCP037205 n=1 Tax=Isosphaera pallida (strain ATCC 43644 / DSM 9630 / IS1B) TaxID=575540 RepID=E8R4S7_ISOPI|nr:Uncharacterized conserved protein UCP037205 [Isosphaera pallida ATCC 43644]
MPHQTPNQRPSKLCPICGRLFIWRKKWERCWDQVVYCSDRCRSQSGRRPNTPPNESPSPPKSLRSPLY